MPLGVRARTDPSQAYTCLVLYRAWDCQENLPIETLSTCSYSIGDHLTSGVIVIWVWDLEERFQAGRTLDSHLHVDGNLSPISRSEQGSEYKDERLCPSLETQHLNIRWKK